MDYPKLSSITEILDRIDQERASNKNSRTYLDFDIAGHCTVVYLFEILFKLFKIELLI